MRLAVFSDIHGNLQAFEAVLADFTTLGGADAIWVLGDLAAMGGRPAECIRKVQGLAEQFGLDKEKVRVIGGNTERYLVNGTRPRYPSAKDADGLQKLVAQWKEFNDILLWNVGQLSFEDYEFLKKIRGAETSLEVPGYGWVAGYHGAPGDDEKFLLPDTPDEELMDAMLDREGRLGIGGHTHKQMDRDLKLWRVVNVGSVGLCWDVKGVAQWGYFTFDDGQVSVDLRSVPYDVDAMIDDLRAVGYPAPEWAIKRLK